MAKDRVELRMVIAVSAVREAGAVLSPSEVRRELQRALSGPLAPRTVETDGAEGYGRYEIEEWEVTDE